MSELIPIRRALLSVSDKTGLIELARALADYGVELISTGGTARALREAGLSVLDISELTGFAEMMDGRVKTLHPKVHGALLAKRDKKTHLEAMKTHKIDAIDLLVVNLYPFEATAKTDADYAACVENIDIGGPAMLRSAAKNHQFVTVLTDIEDYDALKGELARHCGQTSYAFRQHLSAIAFGRTAAYDGAIATWYAKQLNEAAPRRKTLVGRLKETLRYGENPHQSAAFYADPMAQNGVPEACQIQGKALSYNNINDANAALELITEFPLSEAPAAAIIKHTNPCGVGIGPNPLSAYKRALDGDPVSAFGGVVVLNAPLDMASAQAITEIFTEIVIAPDADEDALKLFAEKPNLRLLLTGKIPVLDGKVQYIRSIIGGFLSQERDRGQLDGAMVKIVTKRAPRETEMRDLKFAWRIVKHVKSNAIVCVKQGQTVGIGAGQMSRVESTRIAVSSPSADQSVLASDAFFPFADSINEAAARGITAIIQPGGSQRDPEVIEAADRAKLAMIFTGMRHFRH